MSSTDLLRLGMRISSTRCHGNSPHWSGRSGRARCANCCSSFLSESVTSAAQKQLRTARPTIPCTRSPRSRLPVTRLVVGQRLDQSRLPTQSRGSRREMIPLIPIAVAVKGSRTRTSILTIAGDFVASLPSSESEPSQVARHERNKGLWEDSMKKNRSRLYRRFVV